MNIRKLYIIGNGFDLHHDIKSGYSHFSNWLKENHHAVYKKIVNLYGEEIVNWDWWNDFETNLGYFNIREKIEHYSWLNQPSDEDLEKMRSIDTMGGAWDIQINVGKTIEDVKQCFHKWVDSLSPAKRELKIHLDLEDSYYINFNYTLTLENAYDINPKRICHIHGSINDDEYIIGHGRSENDVKDETEPYIEPYNSQLDPSEYGIDSLEDEIIENAKEEMINQVLSVRKPVEEIISKLQSKLKSFNNVEALNIFGLSFSDVDKHYLQCIFESIPQTASLTISYYSKKDFERIEKLMCDYTFKYKCVRLEELQLAKQLELF